MKEGQWNDRTGLAHMISEMKNQLYIESSNHFKFNYKLAVVKEIRLDD
jgi:hypothetical protein